MKKSLKKVIAVLCAIAMVVTSVTVYNAQTAKASANATGNGKVYTVTDGTNEGFTGFTCNGMEIFSETDGHIGFAWGEKVDPESIKVSINAAEVTTYNANANGVFVEYSQFKGLADGEYPIVVSATTAGENVKQVTGNATLKIQDQGETEPAVTDPSAVKWDTITWLGNGTTDQANFDSFKAYISPANPKKLEVINIQAKNDVNALYMPNNDSPAEKVEVNGADVTGDCITDGAQTFVPVSILTQKYNTVVITTVNGSVLSAFIYNKNGAGSEVQTTPGEVQTTPGEVQTTPGEVQTTPAAEETTPATVETTTPLVVETTPSAQMTFEQVAGANQEVAKGNYGIWINQTNTMDIAVDPSDAYHIQGKIVSNNNNWDQWAVQYKVKKSGLKSGEEYTISVDMKASSDDGVLATDGDKQSVDLKESTSATLTRKATADENGNIVFTIGAGKVGIGVVLDFSNVVVKDAQGNVVGDTPAPETTPSTEETTPSTVETTPSTVETTPAVVETTTQTPVVTTAAPKTTTAAPKTTTVKKLGKTTVNSASKKVASVKVKLTFKKVKGAKKYQVQIAKNKKFKKVLVKKTVKKVKVTIKNKKIKNQKTLYVRVRAVGAKKWSKPKKIKIKK